MSIADVNKKNREQQRMSELDKAETGMQVT